MSYSEILMAHFWGPRNNHVMKEPDAVGVAGVPGNGPFLILYLRVDSERIAEACFQTHGCAPSIAAGSLLCTELPGLPVADAAKRWSEDAIEVALGGLPPHKRHCSILAAEALRRAVERLAAARNPTAACEGEACR